ncbi:MAG: hypothetical protein EOL87_06365 [Spartobacteria bacterium]|nr:hypothetical protein [Spartobacteria bacterium]
MNKIVVKICTGTTCHVMGGGHLFDLEDHIPKEIQDHIQIEASRCLGYCTQKGSGRAPFVMIDDVVMTDATIDRIVAELKRRINNV